MIWIVSPLDSSIRKIHHRLMSLASNFFEVVRSGQKKLFHLKNSIVKQLGLKIPTAAEPIVDNTFILSPGIQLGLLTVCDKKSDIIILGEDDKHLHSGFLFY